MSRISREQVLHVANLARLALQEDEVGMMTEQLDTVLEYAQSLESLDTEGIEPTSQPLPVPTPWREDVAEAPISPDAALANAPERHDTSFVVPKILEADEV